MIANSELTLLEVQYPWPQCVYCKAETELYAGAVAVCAQCASDAKKVKPKSANVPGVLDHQVRSVLLRDLVRTTASASAALQEFNTIMDQFPSGLPHPDGSQRIRNASQSLSIARLEMMTAYSRLDDFLGRGIVPEDLKD